MQYPSLGPSFDSDTDIRAGAHSDYGSLTLLFQRPSQPGLEIQMADSTWSPVPVHPEGTENDPFPPILINIADLFSYWTNGLLKSAVHRVVFPQGGDGADRYSIAYFCHPVDTTKLVPIPSKMVKEAQKSYETGPGIRVLTAGEHLKNRLSATYWINAQSD